MGIEAAPQVRPDESRPSAGRRAAAAAGLLAAVGAFALVVAGLLNSPLRLGLALVALAIALMAAWTALVNRGARRVLGVAVTVVALVGLVALFDLRSIVRISLVIGLVLVSAAAARVALAHDLAPAATESRKVGPAQQGVLLMNPWSGGGKVVRFDLEAEARRRGVTPVVLRRGDDLRALAEQAVAAGADVIGMAGGDGSQALVADVARRHDLPFVCVPAGTRNHFALDLGLDRADVAAALAAYGDAMERRIDLATIGDRVFVNNASMGVYATVVQSDAYRNAKLATTAQLLPDLLGPTAPPFDLRFQGPGGESGISADMVLVSNDVYRLESMSGFGTRARIDDGVLGVVTVAVDRARDLPALISAEATGRIRRFSGYREWTTPEFVVDSGQPLVDVGVDGEALQLAPPLHFRSLPGALRVRTPLDAPGASPAALRPAGPWRTAKALVRVVGGRPGQ
jgi:diacylglycerol kinase family enzyme